MEDELLFEEQLTGDKAGNRGDQRTCNERIFPRTWAIAERHLIVSRPAVTTYTPARLKQTQRKVSHRGKRGGVVHAR